VIDAGSPDLPASPDGSRSDIGALDAESAAAPDCDRDDDPATAEDENCDGQNATVRYGGGCAFQGASVLLLPALAVARRRRPRAAMRR
jgi:hypothetical protein